MNKLSILALILISLALFNCQNISLSDSEIQLLQKIDFEQATITKAKKILHSSFVQYQTSDPGFIFENEQMSKTGLIDQKGILFKVPNKNQYTLIAKIKTILQNSEYLAFLTDLGWGENDGSIVIIKTKDKYDILKYEKPDGINYDLTDIDLQNKLKDWDNKYGIDIIGADYDWVDLEFKSLPIDMTAFTEEIYEFCPDSVDQGVGDIESLEKELLGKRIFLWWD